MMLMLSRTIPAISEGSFHHISTIVQKKVITNVFIDLAANGISSSVTKICYGKMFDISWAGVFLTSVFITAFHLARGDARARGETEARHPQWELNFLNSLRLGRREVAYFSTFFFGFSRDCISSPREKKVTRRMWNSYDLDIDASRSRQELSNEYLIAKISVDTAEIEPSKVWGVDRPFPKVRLSVTANAGRSRKSAWIGRSARRSACAH